MILDVTDRGLWPLILTGRAGRKVGPLCVPANVTGSVETSLIACTAFLLVPFWGIDKSLKAHLQYLVNC